MMTDRSARGDGAVRLAHGELTGRLLRIFFEVYNELGPGFLESVYAQAYAIALTQDNIRFEREASLSVRFRGQPVGVCRPDFVVAGAVVIECKAASALASSHRAQIMNYMRATGLQVGLLLNFGPVPEFKRVINSYVPRTGER